MISAENLKSN